MVTKIVSTAADLILAGVWGDHPKGYRASFMITNPGQHPFMGGGLATTIFYSRRELVQACLFIRKHGPPYLSYISVGDIWSMITGFVSANYWTISPEMFPPRGKTSHLAQLSEGARERFAAALADSTIFVPQTFLALYPLIPVRVDVRLSTKAFFFAPPAELAEEMPVSHRPYLAPQMFPPWSDAKLRLRPTPAWLGVRAPNELVAAKMRSVVLGALALTPRYNDRRMFSGREMFGGVCFVTDRQSISMGRPITPGLMYDIVLDENDRPWIDRVSTLLRANDKESRRHRHALEYFCRSWPLSDSERFPILCMALDALFGDANEASKSVIEGVSAIVGDQTDKDRLQLLMKLRASVIHGGAPDVYDSSKYAKYYDVYEADPIKDLELVLVLCLRTKIFDGALGEHADPNEAQKVELMAMGRLRPHDEVDILAAGAASAASGPKPDRPVQGGA